ncbi:hypothetical protein [Metaclostridioides mangenotii]|jgi:TetR/AcrR family transcriptional regulator|uniref:Uncharacterized protein n=1 Tax=Metaclostridioides mangenotii TaxID=1540 RepID=A0ABS4E6V6_9FIRM|nr:hypothetical protein [Clostridioides mangenotii]MBP1853675.1 hypothetical protein [Clostridioides mangenotii]
MRESFFSLQIDKQNKLIDSGYKVFSLYPYKKASVSIIANEANNQIY